MHAIAFLLIAPILRSAVLDSLMDKVVTRLPREVEREPDADRRVALDVLQVAAEWGWYGR